MIREKEFPITTGQIAERLRGNADLCAVSFETFAGKPCPETAMTAKSDLHELRRALARVEIEIARLLPEY